MQIAPRPAEGRCDRDVIERGQARRGLGNNRARE
jgi:hypothetical protein